MFIDFYNLKEVPFGVTPDPRYLYLSRGHRQAIAALLYGIEAGRGFVSLTGEPGLGKTTLLFQLLQRWKGTVNSAFLFQTQCDSRELIRYLLQDLGLNSEGQDIVRMHSELNQFLFRESLAGRRTVVFIDEAQNLTENVLETVRLLSDFEATDRKLLHIVLAGQPELAGRLSQPGMAQLRQRLAVQVRLSPLPMAEVIPYVNYRLSIAGYAGPGLFTPGALSLIAEHSNGIPRVINNICFHALSLGYAKGSEKITSEIVREVEDDLQLCTTPPKGKAVEVPESAVTAQGHSAQRSFFSFHGGGGLLSRRAARTAILPVVLTSAAMYFGLRVAAGPERISAATQTDSTEAASQTLALEPFTASIPTTPSGQETHAPQRPLPAAKPSQSFLYMVQENDTLRDLCTWATGRYDAQILAEIRKLNPDLQNPDHLEVGQKIRLPLRLRDASPAIPTEHSEAPAPVGAGLQ